MNKDEEDFNEKHHPVLHAICLILMVAVAILFMFALAPK